MAPKFQGPTIETRGDLSNIHIMTAITTAQMRRFKVANEEIQKLRDSIKNSGSYQRACVIIREWFPLDIDFIVLNNCQYKGCQYPGCPKNCKERRNIKIKRRSHLPRYVEVEDSTKLIEHDLSSEIPPKEP